MPTRKIILPTPNAVAASSTALIQCPIGAAYRYRAIHLQIGVLSGTNAVAATALPSAVQTGTVYSYTGDIRLKVNGRTQRLHTASQLARLNSINGSAYAASTWGNRAGDDKWGQVLTLHFAEPWRKNLAQADALALPSSMLNSLEVEVDFGAAPTNAASSNPLILKAWAEVDSEPANSVHRNGPVISKVFRHNLTGGTTAGSAVDVTWLDKRDLYTTIVAELGNNVAFGTAPNGVVAPADGDYTSKLEITANAMKIHELPKGVAKLVHAGQGLNSDQFDLEAVLDSADDINSGLSANGLSELRVRVDLLSDTANSANWTLITERTGPVD